MSLFFPNTATSAVVNTIPYTGPATTPITLMAWFMIPALATPANYRDILVADPNIYMQVFSDGQTMDFGTETIDHTGQLLSAGVWYHACEVVVPASTTSRQIYGYLNGQLQVNVTDTSTFTTYTNFAVGNSVFSGYTFPLNGNVRGVRIWTSPLTPVQVVQEMNSKVPVNQPGLQVWSSFDDNMTQDKSGNIQQWTPGASVTLQAGPMKTYIKRNRLSGF
jgi:Concanavalin A-like lectin/glucanases superfamily